MTAFEWLVVTVGVGGVGVLGASKQTVYEFGAS